MMVKLRVAFYRNATGREPVRVWLRSLDRESKKIIGEDIKTVQYGWPLVCLWSRICAMAFGRCAVSSEMA